MGRTRLSLITVSSGLVLALAAFLATGCGSSPASPPLAASSSHAASPTASTPATSPPIRPATASASPTTAPPGPALSAPPGPTAPHCKVFTAAEQDAILGTTVVLARPTPSANHRDYQCSFNGGTKDPSKAVSASLELDCDPSNAANDWAPFVVSGSLVPGDAHVRVLATSKYDLGVLLPDHCVVTAVGAFSLLVKPVPGTIQAVVSALDAVYQQDPNIG